jgi:hypothetical protein
MSASIHCYSHLLLDSFINGNRSVWDYVLFQPFAVPFLPSVKIISKNNPTARCIGYSVIAAVREFPMCPRRLSSLPSSVASLATNLDNSGMADGQRLCCLGSGWRLEASFGYSASEMYMTMIERMYCSTFGDA